MWVTPGRYLALRFIRVKKVYKPFCLSLTFHVCLLMIKESKKTVAQGHGHS